MSLALMIVLKRAHDVKHPAIAAVGAAKSPHDVAMVFGCGIMVGGVPADMSPDWVAEQIDQKIDAWLAQKNSAKGVAEKFAPSPAPLPKDGD